jgi:hypothetical protein
MVCHSQAGAISRDTMFDLFRMGDVLPVGRSNARARHGHLGAGVRWYDARERFRVRVSVTRGGCALDNCGRCRDLCRGRFDNVVGRAAQPSGSKWLIPFPTTNR